MSFALLNSHPHQRAVNQLPFDLQGRHLFLGHFDAFCIDVVINH